MARVLSIEIETTITRVIEIEYKSKKPTIYSYFSFETPPETVRQGAVKPNEAFVCAFKNEIQLRNIKTKRAIFSLTSAKVISREVSIPKVKPAMIQKMVDTSITEYFPVDPAFYHLVYEVLGENTEKNELNLNLLAVPNELTSGFFEMAKALGLELMHVDYAANGILKAYNYCLAAAEKRESKPEGEPALVRSTHATAIFDIESYDTTMVVADGDRVLLRRVLAIGIGDLFDIVGNSEEYGDKNTPYEEYKVLCSKYLLRKTLIPKEGVVSEESPLRGQVTEAIRPLVQTIGRGIEFFCSKNPTVTIDKVAICGGGTDVRGIKELLKNELAYPVIDIDSMSSAINVYYQTKSTDKVSRPDTSDLTEEELLDRYIQEAKEADSEKNKLFDVSRYVACFGAALSPLDLVSEAQRAGDAETLAARKDRKIFIAEMLGAIIVLIICDLLWFMAATSLSTAKNDKEKVEKHIAQLKESGAEQLALEYSEEKSYSEQLKEMYSSSFSPNDQLVKFIEMLEEKIPSDTLVTSLVANDQGITLNLEAADKESVMKLIHDLRSFPMIDAVSSQSLTDNDSLSIKRGADRIVSYAVTLTYKPLAAESEAAQ